MSTTADPKSALFESAQEISDRGERVSHLNPDAVYYAHLSIYALAVPLCRDALVLDAGCGAGYGSAHLADAGARHVWGIDADAKAIAFCRHHFQRPNLTYQEMSLEQVHGFAPGQLDLVYCSNTLEHVPRVTRFLREAWCLLKPTGALLLAVPPITDDRLEYLNLINPYHVNIWTPRQWAHALGLFFEEAQPVLHGVQKLGADFRPEHFTQASTLTERSFVFAPCSLEEMYETFTLTAVFLAKKPRPEGQVPAADAPLSFVDPSYTRPEGRIDPAARQRLKRYFDLTAPPYVVPASRREKPGLKGIVDRSLAFVAKKLRR